jgi:hypothetical protein
MQRQEIPHHTPEQVREYLREALAVLEEIDPPADIRAPLFTQAAALLSGKNIIMGQPQPVDLAGLNLGKRRY